MKKTIKMLRDIDPQYEQRTLVRKKYEIEKTIDSLKLRIEEAASIEQHKEINEALNDKKGELEQTRNELNWLPRIKNRMAKEKAREIEKVYNEEFKVLRDEYIEMDSQLKKEIASFVTRIEPLVTDMRKTERLETDLKSMLNTKYIDIRELTRLPIDPRMIERTIGGMFTPMAYSLTDSLFYLMSPMKNVSGSQEKNKKRRIL